MANVVPVNPSLRTRVLVLIGAGMALVALVWLAGRPEYRGVGYYFPTWVGANGGPGNRDERLDELTNVNRSLPLVLVALERTSSPLGVGWEKVRADLPGFLRDRVPHYFTPDPTIPSVWISMHAGEPEVARSVVSHWSRWSDELRYSWLTGQSPKVLTNRFEYLPLLRTVAQGTNELLIFDAARLLAAYRPLDLTNANAIDQSLLTSQTGPQMNYECARLLQKLAELDHLPSPIRDTLERWLTQAGPAQAAFAALTLGCIEPSRFPPDTFLEPRFSGLPPDQQLLFLRFLARTGFRKAAASPWGVDFLKQLLVLKEDGTRPDLLLAGPALTVLQEVGPVAAGSAPAILPLLVHTNNSLAHQAASAFTSVALGSPELIPAILPHLTNRTISAPLLLWLSALGPKAIAAQKAVADIAADAVRFPTSPQLQMGTMDPILARRYGLVPQESGVEGSSLRTSASSIGVKPSGITVWPRACPRHLLTFWPGYGTAHRVLTNKFPTVSVDQYFASYNHHLNSTSLAELAQRCLTNMAGGTPP